VANYFNYNSVDILIVKTAESLAKGEIKDEIPENIKIMLKEYLELFKDTKSILEKLGSLCKLSGGKRFCRIISLLYQISLILEISYNDVVEESDKNILVKLFEIGVQKNSRMISKYTQLRNVKDFESIFSQWIFDSIRLMLKNEMEGIDGTRSARSEFISEYTTLCNDPSSLGNNLYHLIEKETEASFEFQVEIIIRSFWCFQVSSDLDGMKKCNLFIKDFLFDELMKSNISLLVHLLISIRNYQQLCFIFDTLLMTNQFQIIEKQKNQVQLKMAISFYLKTKRFKDENQLKMVYTKYEMWTFLGQYMMVKGNAGIAKLYEKMNNGKSGYSYYFKSLINQTSTYFKDASDSFIKDVCVLF
jgi:hypothetical protein